MRHFSENLNDEQARIVEALLTHTTKEEAAKALGVSRATLYRWLQDKELRLAERQARNLALSDATASLQRLANEAALMLSVIMASEQAPYSSRVAAASKLLDLAYRSFELESVAAEIEDLKQELL
jgi:transposase